MSGSQDMSLIVPLTMYGIVTFEFVPGSYRNVCLSKVDAAFSP
jgi:hypothetical protein